MIRGKSCGRGALNGSKPCGENCSTGKNSCTCTREERGVIDPSRLLTFDLVDFSFMFIVFVATHVPDRPLHSDAAYSLSHEEVQRVRSQKRYNIRGKRRGTEGVVVKEVHKVWSQQRYGTKYVVKEEVQNVWSQIRS